MNEVSTERKLHHNIRWEVFAFLAVMAVILVNAILAYTTIDDLSQRHRSIINTGNIIVRLKDLRLAIMAAESGQRGYLLSDEASYLEPYHEALQVVNERVLAVAEVDAELPEQTERLSLLLALVREKITELKYTVALASKERTRQAIRVFESGRGRELSEEIYNLFEDIEANEFSHQAKNYQLLKRAERDALLLFAVFFSVSGLLLLGTFLMQRRRRAEEWKYQQALENRATLLEAAVLARTQELERYSDELSRSNRELEDFAFVASHDLQEPLRKIRTFGSRLTDAYGSELGEKGRDYLQRMNNAAERMSLLISDLLAFSRIKTHGKPFAPVDLNSLITTILDDLEIAIEKSGARILVGTLPTVFGDASQLSQVFLNLLSNAIKFSKHGEAPHVCLDSRVLCREDNAQKFYQLSVTDRGIGFDQDYADKIFQPFQRLHGREEYEGTGIGLAVCRRIIERHGGNIRAESSLGNGTVFLITLPASPVTSQDTQEMNKPPAQNS